MVRVNASEREPAYRCPICSVEFNNGNEFNSHKTSNAHKVKWLKHWYQSNRLLLAQDKNGVEIRPAKNQLGKGSFDHRTGTITIQLQPGESHSITVAVKNSGSDAVILRQVEPLHYCSWITLTDQYGVVENQRFVRVLPDVEYTVVMKAVGGSDLTMDQVPVVFQFQQDNSEHLFFITRTVVLSVVDRVAEESSATSPYKKAYPQQPFLRAEVVPGVPLPPNSRGRPESTRLKPYKYTYSFRHIASKNFSEKKVASEHQEECVRLKKKLEGGLNPANHRSWYETMLWVEEIQMEADIRLYSLEEAKLKTITNTPQSTDFVELKVEGLAEKRPSVLVGDNVYVTHYGHRRPVYAGVVHKVLDASVYLAFDSSFMSTFVDGLRVSVEFEFNRHPQKIYHRALEQSAQLKRLTFPTPPPKPSLPPPKIVVYNRKLENNQEQIQAVQNIVRGSSLPAPYVIFGPPGTGKTVTLVEATKQVLKMTPTSRVLACAPSNAAADLIAERLLQHVSRTDIMRLHAVSRSPDSIPGALKRISNMDDGATYLPDPATLREKRVIVSTMVTAGWLVSCGFGKDQLTHIFLDECGQSTEPEALSALAGLANNNTMIVLTGDPHQLGPVIRSTHIMSDSKIFKDAGLEKSYLERLMELGMYQQGQDGSFNPLVVTKLLNNYRSHRNILHQPNAMFYDSQLKECGDRVLTGSLCNWAHLPKTNFPLIFHAVKGKDQREGQSPSFFNTLEVSRVVDYIKKLLDTRTPKIKAQDIGVITPYRRQVQKLRNQIRKIQAAADVKIGSPEEFQGDERRVIIISTVRASVDHLAHDQFFRLGFLRNPKRFNVAVTRAKALLIVVGCPEILALDQHWGGLLRYIESGGGYTGPSYDRADTDINDVLSRFNKLDLNQALGEEVSARELAEAPAWRADN